jgi:hypothetical protein
MTTETVAVPREWLELQLAQAAAMAEKGHGKLEGLHPNSDAYRDATAQWLLGEAQAGAYATVLAGPGADMAAIWALMPDTPGRRLVPPETLPR